MNQREAIEPESSASGWCAVNFRVRSSIPTDEKREKLSRFDIVINI